jgi:hypothetical protein
MVITARTDWSLSRKSWPMWLGVVVLVLVIASANSGGLANGISNMHVGPTSATPTTWADTAVGNLAGPITLDLTQLPAGTVDTTVRVHDVFGPITVSLPSNPQFHIHIRAHTAFGPVNLPNQGNGNGGMFTTRTADIGPGASTTLDLELVDAFGPITVVTQSSQSSLSPKPTPTPFTKP